MAECTPLISVLRIHGKGITKRPVRALKTLFQKEKKKKIGSLKKKKQAKFPISHLFMHP